MGEWQTAATATDAGSGMPTGDGADVDQIFERLAAMQRFEECADLLQFRSLVTAHQYNRLVRLVRAYVPAGSRVLDWGCGNGHFSYTLWRLGYQVEGFSFEDFGLRRHLPVEYRFTLGDQGSPSELPYPDGSFDSVVSVGVLEHVRETGGSEDASLREIRRILRPGGRFVCYHFPNRYSWIDAASRLSPGAHHHPFRYTAEEIGRLCRDADLEYLSIERYGALPRNMWHRAPRGIRDSRRVARLWDTADEWLGHQLGPVCQNYAFVAENPGRGSAR